MKKIFLLLTCFLFANMVGTMAQVAINTDGTSADANSMLDVKSTAKGVKFPRMTTAQRNAIVTTVNDEGLMVFDTDKGALYMFEGSQWIPFAYAATNPLEQLRSKSATGASKASMFGGSCDISGDYAVAGAYHDDVGANLDQGSAYVFKKINGTWVQQAKLVASDGLPADGFGVSVAISGDYIVVGDCFKNVGNNLNQGVAYVFVRNGDTWTQQAKLAANDGTSKGNFGNSVDIEGATIIVGASLEDVNGKLNQGSAYVFTRSGTSWSLKTKIVANDGQATDQFGESVSIYGNYLAVGASNAHVNGYLCGAAYVFVSNRVGGYTQQTKLISDQLDNSGFFGISVSLDSNKVLVGASTSVFLGGSTGLAHLFTRTNSTWTHTKTFNPWTTDNNTEFGTSVMIKGDVIMISADAETIGGTEQQGSVYLIKYDGQEYQVLKRITDNSLRVAEYFGQCVALDGINYIIGAPYALRYPEAGQGLVFFGTLQ